VILSSRNTNNVQQWYSHHVIRTTYSTTDFHLTTVAASARYNVTTALHNARRGESRIKGTDINFDSKVWSQLCLPMTQKNWSHFKLLQQTVRKQKQLRRRHTTTGQHLLVSVAWTAHTHMWLISAAPVNDTLHGFRTEVLWPSEDTWSEKNRNSSNLRRLSWWNRRHWQTTSELVKQNLWTKAQLMNDDCQPQAAPPSILVACTLTGNSSWAFVYRLSHQYNLHVRDS
jgi:hypothetical protein